MKAESKTGAGIGGGDGSDGNGSDGATTINGGTVVAKSEYGAGIGGGKKDVTTREEKRLFVVMVV